MTSTRHPAQISPKFLEDAMNSAYGQRGAAFRDEGLYGLMMARIAIRSLMHKAALRVEVYRDRLSFLHAVRDFRRRLAVRGAIPPSEKISVS